LKQKTLLSLNLGGNKKPAQIATKYNRVEQKLLLPTLMVILTGLTTTGSRTTVSIKILPTVCLVFTL